MLLISIFSNAAGFSYVYIQGDKDIPFYVKLEDEMLPRYGKNYCIISQLAPGTIHIKILFQQNAYPVQNFTIQVPENGFRGFLLVKKEEAFSLYDIQQQFYLSAGNKEEEDKIPAAEIVKNNTAANINVPIESNTLITEQNNQVVAEDLTDRKSALTASTVNAPTLATKKEPVGPEFIDIELTNDRTKTDNGLSTGNKAAQGNVLNSDCPKFMNSELFDAIRKKADDKGDKGRLKYLLSKTEDNCFNTNQVKILAKALPNDPEKYTFLKKVYPRVTDQSKFPALESLLITQEWKSYFRLIIDNN